MKVKTHIRGGLRNLDEGTGGAGGSGGSGGSGGGK
jgi:hypothetical protein